MNILNLNLGQFDPDIQQFTTKSQLTKSINVAGSSTSVRFQPEDNADIQ